MGDKAVGAVGGVWGDAAWWEFVTSYVGDGFSAFGSGVGDGCWGVGLRCRGGCLMDSWVGVWVLVNCGRVLRFLRWCCRRVCLSNSWVLLRRSWVRWVTVWLRTRWVANCSLSSAVNKFINCSNEEEKQIKKLTCVMQISYSIMCSKRDSNSHGHFCPKDFKSFVSTIPPFERPESGKRDSNSRPQPWQGCALPTELFPQMWKANFPH